jgi:starch phosphorylase
MPTKRSPKAVLRHRPSIARAGLTPAALRQGILNNLYHVVGRFWDVATPNDHYLAVAYAVRDRLLDRWVRTAEHYYRTRARTVCYLSAEYLLGPHLGNVLINLGVLDEVREVVKGLGVDLEQLLELEEEPGLGNGGLGRLAACFMDSLSTLQIPAIGYGIRYEFGIFDQVLRDGWQVEMTDKWLRLGNPWEIPRPEIAYPVRFGGRTEAGVGPDGRYRVRWVPDRMVRGVAYDTPIPGYRVPTVNLLRLWKAEAVESFDFQAFNTGDYYGAVDQKVASETISRVLYPNDEPEAGKRLRLEQQYFFVSCSLQDMIRLHLQTAPDAQGFENKYAVQLNDTHPAVAVPELMRLLVDEHGWDWEPAWAVTCRTFAYTNHTLLPEALETWSEGLFGAVLPRHLEIVREINRRFLEGVRHIHPSEEDRARRLSILQDGRVRMAHLACVGSRAVNGVAALHTELLKRDVLHDFYALQPERFHSITNGVTPRRFLLQANPGLARLLTGAVGEGWPSDLERLRALEPLADDAGFREEWWRVKRANREALVGEIRRRAGVEAAPEALMDCQAKRIHEYKRQHLNALHIIALYHRLLRDPGAAVPSRTFLFAGKAAPGYYLAKLIIRLITGIAMTVNADPRMRGRLRVAFWPNYNVKNSRHIFPGTDLSEQISTAGKEASGTGNMKFALNGALTIGTLDGANVEIREAVGSGHFFLFGLDADGVRDLWRRGYDPRAAARADAELSEALEAIAAGAFSGGDRDLFRPLLDNLLHHDPFLVLADFPAYRDAQRRVEAAWADPEGWTRSSILNTARAGRFSSDRAIAEYCRLIWQVEPCPVPSETVD